MEEHKSRKVRKRKSLLSAGNCSAGTHLRTNNRSSLKIVAPTVPVDEQINISLSYFYFFPVFRLKFLTMYFFYFIT